MPIPKPKKGETKKDFINRCMGDDIMATEYPDSDQRTAVCATAYEDSEDSKENDNELETKQYIEINTELKATEGDDEGIFNGYGSIFGNKDLGNDIVEKGAFLKSLNDRGAKGVKLLWQHKTDQPIGVFEEIREDNKGLKVKGKLALGTQGGKEAYELMKMGALDGMSIGYRADPAKQKYDEKNKRRFLKEVDLMEISFPMNPRATIHAVKGEDMNIRDLEKGLRDAFSFSRSDAKVGAKALHDIFNKQRDAENKGDIELLEAIRQTTTFLTKITKE
jgi:HK97 family phage prohead protease